VLQLRRLLTHEMHQVLTEPVYEFRFLGQFAVHLAGEPVRLTSRPSQSLLAYLCLHAGKAFRRERLAGLLWPEASETSARNNLRQALWRIRKALEDGGAGSQDCLLADDLSIAFDARAPYWLDVEVLTRPLPSDPSPADLAQAVAVYGGELLPGFYDEWTMLERERLQAVYKRRMGQLLELLTAEQDWTQTMAWVERWIALGSTPEATYRSLMIAHAAMGDLAGMSAAYQRCVDAPVVIWDTAAGQRIGAIGSAARDTTSVDFDPAGARLATLGFDGTVRLRDATSGTELLTIAGENNGADLTFSPDGRYLAAASGSGKISVYAVHLDDLLALARSRLTRSLTPAECQRYLRVENCPR
jgi:DNA-binding SARP family transcriptional activator